MMRTGRCALGRLLAVAVVAAGLTACSRQAAAPAPPQTAAAPQGAVIPIADRPPGPLVDLGQSAKSLFDAADVSDWAVAAERIQSLDESAAALPATLPKPDLVAQLQSRLSYIKQHVSDHRRTETMDDANAITRLVADLSAEFHPLVPYEAVMLGYYGRQVELGLVSQQSSTISRAVTDLRSTWNRIEPAVERVGNVTDARRFTDIVAALESARRPADFVAPTRAALTDSERIEQLFRSAATSPTRADRLLTKN